MIITRELQNATWEFDTEKQEATLTVNEPNEVGSYTRKTVILNKTYMFSLSRFLTRSFQKMSQKQYRKEVKKHDQ